MELPVEVVEAVPPVTVALPMAVPVCSPLGGAEEVTYRSVVGLEVRVAVRVALRSKLVVGREEEEGVEKGVEVEEGVALTVLLPVPLPLPLIPGREGREEREEEVDIVVEGVKLGTRVPTRDVVGKVEGEEVEEALALPPQPPLPMGVAVPLPPPLGPEGVELELGWVERVDVPLVLGLGVEERVALVDPVPTGHPPPPHSPSPWGGQWTLAR